jgi:hypothetical protein
MIFKHFFLSCDKEILITLGHNTEVLLSKYQGISTNTGEAYLALYLVILFSAVSIKSDNLNIASVQDSKATQMKASSKGFLSSSVSIDTGILDVDIFGVTTNAIVCLNVNTHCMNVVVGIKRNVIATEG